MKKLMLFIHKILTVLVNFVVFCLMLLTVLMVGWLLYENPVTDGWRIRTAIFVALGISALIATLCGLYLCILEWAKG